jgi:hypothetical protein
MAAGMSSLKGRREMIYYTPLEHGLDFAMAVNNEENGSFTEAGLITIDEIHDRIWIYTTLSENVWNDMCMFHMLFWEAFERIPKRLDVTDDPAEGGTLRTSVNYAGYDELIELVHDTLCRLYEEQTFNVKCVHPSTLEKAIEAEFGRKY